MTPTVEHYAPGRIRERRFAGAKATTIACVLIGWLVIPSAIGAQETPPAEETVPVDDAGAATPTAGLEALQVTGNAGGKVWQDVPNSAIGFDALELQRERVQDISDISNFTPNLEIKTAFAASNPTLFIRGIGLDDFNANSASAVAVYQDGVYMNSPAGQLFQFFDVQNVTVLRGPHAGRYRNASAGAILVQSQRPTQEFETYGTFTAGNYDLYEVEGALNLPLVDDILMSRFSGKWTQRDGYTENRCAGRPLERPTGNPSTIDDFCFEVGAPGFSLGTGQDLEDPVNDADNFALRGQLLFDVPLRETSMEWLLNVHGGQNRSLAAQFQQRSFRLPVMIGEEKVPGLDRSRYSDADDDPFSGEYNDGGNEDLDLFGVNLTGRWAISDVHEIVSLSAVEWHDRETLENSDANPRNLLATLYQDEAWQFSQDFRLESFWTENLQTNVGAYYIMEDLEVFNQFDQFDSRFLLAVDYTQELRSTAVYGELVWDFLRDFTFETNLRYTQEFKEFDNFSTVSNPSGVSGVGLSVGVEDETFTGVSGLASLTYRITDEQSVYGKYTRGWKPGHFNGGSVFSGQLIEPVKPEDLNAVEIGYKGSFFDGRLNVDLAGFYYDYTNLQIFTIEQDVGANPLPQLINAEGAEIYGAELGLRITPLRGLDLRYDIGYLNSEYSRFENVIFVDGRRAPGEPVPPPVPLPIVYSGNRMIGSPTWSMSGSIQYAIPLFQIGEWSLGEIVPRFSFTWKDETFFDAGEGKGVRVDLPDDTTTQPSYVLYNAGVTWRAPGQWLEVTGWVRNLSDEEYLVQSFDISQLGYVLDAYGAPRTYGITISAFF